MRVQARALISVLGAMACGRPAVSLGPGSTLLPYARDAEVPVARARRALDPPRPTLSILAPDAPPMEVQQEPEPIRWTLSNGLHVEHRGIEGTGLVHLRLVVIGPGAAADERRTVGSTLRLAAGIEQGGTRRNPRALFLDALSAIGTELRVDLGRRGLVAAMDVSSEHGAEALGRLAELALERAPFTGTLTASEWLASRLGSLSPAGAAPDALDATTRARLSALDHLRAGDPPWSPREWSERLSLVRWNDVSGDALSDLARQSFRAGAMTLVIAGDLPIAQARALTADRWSALPRGAGVPVRPLRAARDAGPARYAEDAAPGASHVWVFDGPASPALRAALALLAATIGRCAPPGPQLTVSFYPDPERSALALSVPFDPAQIAAIRALPGALERMTNGECLSEHFATARAELLRELQPWDGRAWADARAWAVHDGTSPEDARALAGAVADGAVESVRTSLRVLLANARAQWGVSGPREQIPALCAAVGGPMLEGAGGERIACPSR